MNQEQIKTFIDALAASALSELEFSENGWTLRLAKHAAPAAIAPGADAPAPALRAASSVECLAPLYGVVHLQGTPGDPPFVEAGQAVAAGQTLCVIEAMKVFNEVRAERDGVLQSVLVASGDEVEAGQPLFRFA
ncbi:acetyl-CoA carboxylase biotin carboxyl carrier protein [Variovorax sp. PBL-E5]|uniref:acetyl-CoA carboxylase biotin carboxyl carrier protein n=1 Tax=Variovorax sp. PBL-E5 TaxID=434014 RepID=UPI001316956E|nr:acetyl-CoA carboxylase biotin carboxyl carrier protein subunit [Variovorax sp. PBL-E5]VTU31824.1 Biotin carboxyl carrier protein of acetyl-CoA carboxylase [Variovorax sp. PBL-E5]